MSIVGAVGVGVACAVIFLAALNLIGWLMYGTWDIKGDR